MKGRGRPRLASSTTPRTKRTKQVVEDKNQPKLNMYLVKKKSEEETKENEKSEDENQPKVIVNHRRTLTNVDDETNPINGEQQTNLHLIESKPTQVKRNSVKELTKMFSKPPDKKPAPPPTVVNFRETVPVTTQNYGRLPSMKNTRDMGTSCGEGKDSTKKPGLGLVGLEGEGNI